jgi:hypothetical protein
MSKKTFYRQCRLTKKDSWQVSWLPEKFAVVGKVLKLRNDKDEEWDNGWVVTGAGENLIDEPPYAEAMIRGHRKNTGDSLPKEKKTKE